MQHEPKRPVFHPNICFLMVLIRLIYENKGDIAILRIICKKNIGQAIWSTHEYHWCFAFLRLHNFQSSGIVLPFAMSIFFVSTYIHHYTVHQFSSLFSFLIIISDIFLRLLHSRTFSFFLDHLSIIPCEAAISCLKVITRL